MKQKDIITAQQSKGAGSLALPAAINSMATTMFKGTLNALVTDALILFGTNSARKTAIAGQYMPKPNSNAQNANKAMK